MARRTRSVAPRRRRARSAAVGDVVAIEWDDAWAEFGQAKLEGLADYCIVTTFGILIRDSRDVVSIAWERMGDEDEPVEKTEYRSVTNIPRGMVRSIRVLR